MKLDKLRNFKAEEKGIVEIALLVIMFIEIVAIAYFNIRKGHVLIDQDMANAYVHTIEMARNHSIFIPDWMYATTMELDCASLFALPIYMLCGNIFLSYAISNIIFVGLYIWTIFMILRNDALRIKVLACVIIFVPYGIYFLDYFNMMFFNAAQYNIKVLIPLMLIGVLNLDIGSQIQRRTKVESICFIIICFTMLFITSLSSGIYVAVCGVFPIFIAYFVWDYMHKQRITIRYWLYLIMSICCTVLGVLVNTLAGIDAKGNSMELCNIYDLKDNIASIVLGLFELFKGVPYVDVPIASYDGIVIITRIIFVLTIIGVIGYSTSQILKDKTESRWEVLCIAVFWWNLFVLMICKTGYSLSTSEYRYQIIGIVPVMLIYAKYMMKICADKKLLNTVFILAVLVLMLTSYRTIIHAKPDESEFLPEICEYSKANHLERIYFYRNMECAAMCRVLDENNRLYIGVDESGNLQTYDYYADSVDAGMTWDEGSVLIVNSEYNETAEEINMFGYDFLLEDQIGYYMLYKVQ